MNARADRLSTTPHMPQNIFLVGLMGAGKTSVGKMLSRRLNKTFYDSDQEIEREQGFRARESKMLSELVHGDNIVLATGGGAVLSEQNRRLLAAHGTVIYLRATASDLWRRTRHDKNRPLLQAGNPLEKLQELLAQRDPLYREVADIIIDTGSQSLGNLASRIEQQLAQLKPEHPRQPNNGTN
jgi:shikimate kinase